MLVGPEPCPAFLVLKALCRCEAIVTPPKMLGLCVARGVIFFPLNDHTV